MTANEAYVQHSESCELCQAVDSRTVPGARRCLEGKQKVAAAEKERRGDILGECHGGNVIFSSGRRNFGAVVWASSAFNPLTSDQLREVADYMDGRQWKSN